MRAKMFTDCEFANVHPDDDGCLAAEIRTARVCKNWFMHSGTGFLKLPLRVAQQETSATAQSADATLQACWQIRPAECSHKMYQGLTLVAWPKRSSWAASVPGIQIVLNESMTQTQLDQRYVLDTARWIEISLKPHRTQ